MPTKKKRQPVQIDGDIMKQLRELGELLQGVPVTRIVRTALEMYLSNNRVYVNYEKAKTKARGQLTVRQYFESLSR